MLVPHKRFNLVVVMRSLWRAGNMALWGLFFFWREHFGRGWDVFGD